jgi:hypothetical protein
MVVKYDVAPYCTVDTDRFRPNDGDIKARSCSDAPVSIYRTTRRRENLNLTKRSLVHSKAMLASSVRNKLQVHPLSAACDLGSQLLKLHKCIYTLYLRKAMALKKF